MLKYVTAGYYFDSEMNSSGLITYKSTFILPNYLLIDIQHVKSVLR